MDVLVYPNPLLRRGGKDITAFDAGLRDTVRAMFDSMYAERGVGLAAPQVGLALNLLVLNPTGEAAHPGDEQVLVNPVIKAQKGRESGEEGCLSFPGIYGEVERATQITVAYLDAQGAAQEATFTDFLARIVQHEMDHLRGVLFVDRLSAVDKVRVRPRLLELEREFHAAAE
jgi:peptide deformylase